MNRIKLLKLSLTPSDVILDFVELIAEERSRLKSITLDQPKMGYQEFYIKKVKFINTQDQSEKT